MIFYCDNYRHLVCLPYNKENLFIMAKILNIKKCWFHKTHFDIPKKRIKEIKEKCILITSKNIINIINGKLPE
jgi:hypothetical protein